MNWVLILFCVLLGLAGVITAIVVIILIAQKLKTPNLRHVRKLSTEGNTSALADIALRGFDPSYKFVSLGPSLRVQIAAVRAIHTVGGRQAIELLVTSCDDENEFAQMSVALILMIIEETRAQGMAILIKEYLKHPSVVMAWIKTAAKDEDEGLRAAIVETLGNIQSGSVGASPIGLSVLLRALEDYSPRVRTTAAKVIGANRAYHCEKAAVVLARMVGERWVVDGPLKDVTVRLTETLKDPDETVSNAVAEALKEIDRHISCWICSKESGDMIPFECKHEVLSRIEVLNLMPTAYYESDSMQTQTRYICLECFDREKRYNEGIHINADAVLGRLLATKMASPQVSYGQHRFAKHRYNVVSMRQPRRIHSLEPTASPGFCTRCGQPLRESSRFCPGCGCALG